MLINWNSNKSQYGEYLEFQKIFTNFFGFPVLFGMDDIRISEKNSNLFGFTVKFGMDNIRIPEKNYK